ncbi:hypothetical protein N7486_009673 [Penicillium sp. IBT 16267x]|nr:hypothetical protein N7486_009673 [Penicillium sp. IBT 16267x]
MAGEASAILTLTIFAFDASKSLYEAISRFKSQRKTIQDLRSDLISLTNVLTSVHTQAQSPEEAKRLEPLRQPIDCCWRICQELHETLPASEKQSAWGRDKLQAWLKVEYHGKSIEDMKQRLASYKSTLCINFDLIHLRDHSITQSSLYDLQNTICGVKDDLEDQLDRVKDTISAADASIRDILQVDQALLQRSLESLERAQLVADTAHPQVTISKNRSDEHSRAIFGTDTSQPKFDLNVSENEVGVNATAAAGVHTPQTLQTLLGGDKTANFPLQILRNELKSTNQSGIQSIQQILQSRLSENANPTGLIEAPPQSVDPIDEITQCDTYIASRCKDS